MSLANCGSRLDEIGRRRAAAQRLDADHAGAREDIDEDAIRNRVAHDAEKRLANTLRRRPQIFGNDAANFSATQSARNHSDKRTHESPVR